MLVHNRYRVVPALVMCLLLAGARYARAGSRTVTIPLMAKYPAVSGSVTAADWGHSVQLQSLDSLYETKKPIQQTAVRAMYDSKFLYLDVKCSEVNMSSLVANANGADSAVLRDDNIEVFIDTANAHHMYYMYSVNPSGGCMSKKSIAAEFYDAKWVSRLTVNAKRVSGAWDVQMKIPFAELGIKPTPGLVMGLNICRCRKAGDPEYSAWNPCPAGFEQPNSFGEMVLGDVSGKSNGIKLLSWGKLSSDIGALSANILQCSIPNSQTKPLSFQTTLRRYENGKANATFTKTVVVRSGQTGKVAIPYLVKGTKGESWAMNIKANGVQLFSAVHPAARVDSIPRVWQVKDPLFKELLSNTPAGLQKNGAIYWGHTYPSSLLSPFAKEYAVRYSKEEASKELADDRLLMIPWPVRPDSILGDPYLMKMSEKYHFKMLFYPDVVTKTATDLPNVGGSTFLIDPRNRAHYFDDLRSTLQKGRKYIWGIYTGDEFTEYNTDYALRLYWDHKDKYPYINEINEQVKNKYGFGKYGMPESVNDDNPYRWIAFHKWINNYWLGWQKEVYNTVQQLAPEIKVISIDPVVGPGHRPIGFDRLAAYFDVATQQMYPPKDPNRQQFGFTTKMVSDLTGKPTWTCTHVEYYPYSTTLEETRELMSEVMRNGGKGFHFWLKDEFGNNSPNGFLYSTKWGFPERWRAIMEINKLNATMNEVAVPTDPDLAVFYSEDYYQSYPEKFMWDPTEPEWAYTFFGPVARTWFIFVNDNMVEDGKVDLSTYKALVITAAKYERPNVVDAIVKYVEDGGTLVVGDPEAFTTSVNGDSLAAVRSKLIGACVPGKEQKSVTFNANCSIPQLANRTLTVTGPVYSVTPQADAEIMAHFADGTPAVVRNRVGKGSVILFAFNPFTETGIADERWKSFFTAFSQGLGLKTGRDIWRFKFPPYKTVNQADPKGVCLTGNYIKWWQDKPADIQNASISGKYAFSIVPDGIADRGSASGVPFVLGKLTDRTRAYTTLKTNLKPEDFSVTWKTGRAVDLTFDLVGAKTVTGLNLWYSDQLPGFTVEGSMDGKNWRKLASYPKKPYVKSTNPAESDVLDLSLKLSSDKKVRFVRVSFGRRDPGNAMTLVECELWGSESAR